MRNADIAAHAAARSGSRPVIQAAGDLVDGLRQWRVWWVLGFNDVRKRYRRSRLGQFWFTMSMAATVAGIGLVFGVIFDRPLGTYLPFLGIGLILWNFMSTLVNDLSMSFVEGQTYIRAYPGPKSIIIYQIITKNIIIFLHNFIIVVILILFFDTEININIFLFFPFMVLLVLNSVWIGLLLGPLCARYRDLPQVIATIVQLAFFLTPILYLPEQLRSPVDKLVYFNPFASFMELVRAPLLGYLPGIHDYLIVAAWTIVGFSIAVPFYARFRGRIAYWI